VIHRRHLLLSPVEVPLPRLLVKAQRVIEEAEAGFWSEWEKLDWERHLGNREKMGRVIDEEIAVVSREKAVARKEKEVELKERSARHTIDAAKAMAKTIDDEQATLNHREHNLTLREVGVKEEEDRLSALRTDLEARTQSLEDRRLRQEEESRSLFQWLEALKHREAEVEELLAEQRTGVQRITKWVDEASTTLEPLRLSPIHVAEAPSSISSVHPELDSAAERLQRLESSLLACLEAKGRELAQMVVDHVLTCFRSHDPAISLTPVLEGPLPGAPNVGGSPAGWWSAPA
jgi:hypothetical protein